jgi:hypothetical protein
LVNTNTATSEEDIEMAEFSEHDLIMIQRWQRMHGTNQWKQGGLTPSKDNPGNASPLNKKKKKSSGVLFPSPKDTNFPHSLHRELEQEVANERSELAQNGAIDTEMDGDQGLSEDARLDSQHMPQEEIRLPGSPAVHHN